MQLFGFVLELTAERAATMLSFHQVLMIDGSVKVWQGEDMETTFQDAPGSSRAFDISFVQQHALFVADATVVPIGGRVLERAVPTSPVVWSRVLCCGSAGRQAVSARAYKGSERLAARSSSGRCGTDTNRGTSFPALAQAL